MPERKPTRAELDLFGKVVGDAVPLGAKKADPLEADAESPEKKVENPADRPPQPKATRQSGSRKTPGRRSLPVEPEWTPVPAEMRNHRAGSAPGTDRRLQMRLKRGQIPIDGRIDLHGLSRERAHAALNLYLDRQQALGHRCILVITGKGRPDWDQPAWGSEGGDRRDPPRASGMASGSSEQGAGAGVHRRSDARWRCWGVVCSAA